MLIHQVLLIALIKQLLITPYVFDKCSLIKAVEYLIFNCYFTVGDTIMKQIIGIPLGGDPAPFWADLFLFHYESKWILKMKRENNILARKFGSMFRFLDDLDAMNDGGEFERNLINIYPPE